MKKKALLVAVGDYRGFAPALNAPVHELGEWRTLLQARGFSVTPLADSGASRTKVLDAFRTLITGAQPDDELVFGFFGHGSTVAVPQGATGSFTFEQALMVYPVANDVRLKSSAITAGDMSRIVMQTAVPEGTDLTLIIDSCFSGGFDEFRGNVRTLSGSVRKTEDGDPTVLFIRPQRLPKSTDEVREFGVFAEEQNGGALGSVPASRSARLSATASKRTNGRGGAIAVAAGDSAATPKPRIERPIVVAASGRNETAIELSFDGTRRLLFSKRATEFLATRPQATFEQLIAGIKPLKAGIRQTPELRVNTERATETFPGEPQSPVAVAPVTAPALSTPNPLVPATRTSNALAPTAPTVLTLPAPIAPVLRRTGASRSASAESLGEETVNTIDVFFKGMCCFLDARRESDPYQKRVVLPYDDRVDPKVRHKAFIEVASDQISSYGVTPTVTTGHENGTPLDFFRWELHSARVSFENADNTAPLTVQNSYVTSVPGMKTGVYDALPYHPSLECFTDPPSRTRVSAYVDLDCGTLSAGPLEPFATQFTSATAPTGNFIGRTPKWVVLNLPLTQSTARIRIGDGADDWIAIKPGGSALIGNEREYDIIEHPDLDEPAETFFLYYELDDGPLIDPPLPTEVSVPLNGCSVTNWP
jgi:hypothetical protein